MGTIEKLTIFIDGDSKGAVAAAKATSASIKNLTKNIESAASKMKSAGLKMSLAITAPLVLIGKASLEAAMDVIESENLFEESMENMADSAREWSKELREDLGLNEYEIRKQVGIFNVMLLSMGLGEQAAYDMAKGIVQLGYDMASFYNLQPEEAFAKLSSGIVGMSRPLQDMGILVNETVVSAWALKEGIIGVGESLTETQKVLARYGTIMEATIKSQGDLARTLDSPANKLRIFQSQVDMLKIELGTGLLPMFMKVLDKLEPMVEGFGELSDEQQQLIINLALVAAAAGPVLLILGNLLTVTKSLVTGVVALNVATKGLLFTVAPIVTGYTALATILLGVAKGLSNVTERTISLSGVTMTWTEKMKASLSILKELIQIVTLYPPLYGRIIGQAFGGTKQSKQLGGMIFNNQFADDLNIPLVKGEAVLPAPVVQAIKENRGSFAGLDTSGDSSIINNFNISELVVREEADIDRISEKLHDMQLREQRGGGYR